MLVPSPGTAECTPPLFSVSFLGDFFFVQCVFVFVCVCVCVCVCVSVCVCVWERERERERRESTFFKKG